MIVGSTATTTFLASLALLALGVDAFVPPSKLSTPTTSSSSLQAERQPIMAGNWKMNPMTEDEAVELSSALTGLLGEETCPFDDENDMCTEVVIFPPHPYIRTVKDTVEEAGISVGAQSIFWEKKGAYTGEVAGSMIKSIGCEYVLCGHSERRSLFSDDDEAINKKVLKVLEDGLKPILCIGETKDEFDMKIRDPILKMQLSNDLYGVTKEQMESVVIAYEPVWAIGTGLVCGSEDASKYISKTRNQQTKSGSCSVLFLKFVCPTFLFLCTSFRRSPQVPPHRVDRLVRRRGGTIDPHPIRRFRHTRIRRRTHVSTRNRRLPRGRRLTARRQIRPHHQL